MRFSLWLLVAWPAPALVAGALGWKGVWGSGSALVDYLIPLPVAGGVFHVMTFAAFTAMLATLRHWPPVAAGAARGLLLGVSLFAAWLLFDPHRGRLTENPVALFLLSDSLLAQAFVGAFGGRAPDGARGWSVALAAAVLLPVLGAIAVTSNDPRAGQPFVHAGTRPGPQRADASYFVHSRHPLDAPGVRAAAAAFAEERHPRHDLTTEDVAVHFFSSLDAARRLDLGQATATYCLYQDGTAPVWHNGKGDCFAHETVSDRLERAYSRQDAKLAPEERVRLARTEACAGVRVPAEDNAIARQCGKPR